MWLEFPSFRFGTGDVLELKSIDDFESQFGTYIVQNVVSDSSKSMQKLFEGPVGELIRRLSFGQLSVSEISVGELSVYCQYLPLKYI